MDGDGGRALIQKTTRAMISTIIIPVTVFKGIVLHIPTDLSFIVMLSRSISPTCSLFDQMFRFTCILDRYPRIHSN